MLHEGCHDPRGIRNILTSQLFAPNSGRCILSILYNRQHFMDLMIVIMVEIKRQHLIDR